MFNESWPWKRDLQRSARRLRKVRFALARKLERAGVENESDLLYPVERDVMFGCFAVRRLIGMPSKVTKKARETKVTVTRYPKIDSAPAANTWASVGELDNMYDYDAPEVVRVSANAMCNLFIHSLILRFAWTRRGMTWADWYWHGMSEENANELAGFLVASDDSANRVLTFVPLEEIIRLFQVLAKDKVVLMCMRRDRNDRMHWTGLGPDEFERHQVGVDSGAQ